VINFLLLTFRRRFADLPSLDAAEGIFQNLSVDNFQKDADFDIPLHNYVLFSQLLRFLPARRGNQLILFDNILISFGFSEETELSLVDLIPENSIYQSTCVILLDFALVIDYAAFAKMLDVVIDRDVGNLLLFLIGRDERRMVEAILILGGVRDKIEGGFLG
jgi:hypothetical protein